MNDPRTGAWDPDHAQAAYLARLRAEFPGFGIIADFRRPLWMAVRRDMLIKAADGPRLREHLLEASRSVDPWRVRL
ncbi:hypothetical protein [Actinomadura sp. 9N407]|uniref:hypothetical protein n=1 Tax=Actinomadura sp. 9N407 TaxID=3375154 RepID=UPI0037A066D7